MQAKARLSPVNHPLAVKARFRTEEYSIGSIAVRVVIALGIDLIEDGFLKPTWPGRKFQHEVGQELHSRNKESVSGGQSLITGVYTIGY
jgi:hypothetical protein